MAADPFDLAARFAAPPAAPPAGGGDGVEERDPAPLADEAAYVCDACGEEIVVPVDVAAGAAQEYVEDCPVCCRPNVLSVLIDADGRAACRAVAE